MIGWRSGSGFAPSGKRSWRALPVAVGLATACMFVAACDAGHDDARTVSGTAQAMPMLPGTRSTAASPSAGAQRFDSADGSEQHAASDALLPPVMHSAD